MSRFSPAQWAGIGVVFLAFVGLFWEWMYRQHRFSWTRLDDWGHAYAIPFISLYILWTARHRLVAEPIKPFWPAFPPMLLGVASYVFFIVGIANHMLQGFALILVLGSVLLFTLGPRAFRHMFLPVAFLLFAITISEQIMIRLTFPLQLIASQGAYWIMSAAWTIWSSVSSNDFLVTLKGNTLVVDYMGKSHPLNVAEACSGMRMVIAFLSLSAAVGLFGCKFWWQRTALLVLATPVAVILNVFRVALLGFLTMYDPGLATGDAHMIIGTLLLVPGLFAFMGLMWILNRCVASSDETKGAPKGPKKPQTLNGPSGGPPLKPVEKKLPSNTISAGAQRGAMP